MPFERFCWQRNDDMSERRLENSYQTRDVFNGDSWYMVADVFLPILYGRPSTLPKQIRLFYEIIQVWISKTSTLGSQIPWFKNTYPSIKFLTECFSLLLCLLLRKDSFLSMDRNHIPVHVTTTHFSSTEGRIRRIAWRKFAKAQEGSKTNGF